MEIVLEHLAGDDGVGLNEACSKKVNNQYRHLLVFNEKCIRCLWNEWQYRNKNIRLSDTFMENDFLLTKGERAIRISLQHFYKN